MRSERQRVDVFLILGQASHNLALNATLVATTTNLEVAICSPILVPAVGDPPVVHATIDTPTEDLDGMATESRAGLVRVDAALVGEEVLVDSEGSLCGAVLHQLVLDIGDTAGNRVRRRAKVLGLGPVIAILTLLGAGRSGADSRAWAILASGVVVTVGQLEGEAAATLVVATIDQARVHPIGPSSRRVTAVASHATGGTARVEIGGRQVSLVGAIGGDAKTVSHCLCCTKRPA